jgi:hypothetical protein
MPRTTPSMCLQIHHHRLIQIYTLENSVGGGLAEGDAGTLFLKRESWVVNGWIWPSGGPLGPVLRRIWLTMMLVLTED